MNNNNRCLYQNSFGGFLEESDNLIFGIINDKYHGDTRSTTREAWKDEIAIMKDVVSRFDGTDGRIIFEYDIPRLAKRIDVVLLYRGIIFCIEFKVGENKILEGDVDQVLDYALDLNNFHKFSQGKVIVPILVATNYEKRSTKEPQRRILNIYKRS